MAAEAYLRAARDVGALRTVGEGCLVAGEYLDAARGRSRYLVTYCDDRLARDGSLSRALPALARAEAPTAREALLRLGAGLELAPPWRRHITYLRHARAAAGEATAVEGLTVVAATGRHDDLVFGWLAAAIEEAARSQAEPATAAGVGQVARQVLDAPGRCSYLALCDGRPIGHATLLCRERDDVSGEDFIELFDVLVVPGHRLHHAAVRLLTARATEHAERHALPLVGNVIHPSDPGGAARARQIVRELEDTGWTVDHTLWTCSLAALEETPWTR